ncbi:MAG: helix-turn-helix domain-containing protein [Clostridia bacterium]|nr:helix-turn-helix domain-containing protein [Clostridia bacterium]
MMDERLLTVEETAERLAVSPRSVRAWLRTGELRGVKVRNLWRVPESAIDEFLEHPQERRVSRRGEEDEEDREWLDAAAEEMAKALEETERDVPLEELAAWREAMARTVRPARYVPGKGLLVRERKT